MLIKRTTIVDGVGDVAENIPWDGTFIEFVNLRLQKENFNPAIWTVLATENVYMVQRDRRAIIYAEAK